jgi:hypothetical protein
MARADGRSLPEGFPEDFPSGSCDESCGSFADKKMMTISNFSQLEWLKRLHAGPQAAPRSRWSHWSHSVESPAPYWAKNIQARAMHWLTMHLEPVWRALLT